MHLPRFTALVHGLRVSGPVVLALASCTSSPSPVREAQPAPSASAPVSVATAAPSATEIVAPVASTSASASATPSASAVASAEPAPLVKDNQVKPISNEQELTDRVKALFDAIVKDDPTLADVFWFPRDPFLVLKDIKDPGKYWDQLHKTYAKDIHKLHGSRSWDGVTFDRYEVGSTPKWIKPGDEGNKIGYYRSFAGKLHYRAPDGPGEIEVRVAITWQGRWYITHLSKFKH